MKAATCVADITPHCKVHLCGYVGEARKEVAQGVHDNPLAVSLLLEIESERLLFISIDVLAIGAGKAKIIKNKIRENLGMKEENIIINAIHSHSLANGFVDINVFDTPDNPEYFAYAVDRIVDSLENIENNLKEVKAFIGTTKVHGYYSKRTDITSPFEDNATVIKYMHEDEVVAAMCNFNCHATVLGPNNMQLSADLIGEVRSQMAEYLNVIPYTFTGASGDISNRQYRQGNDFNELKRVGTGIAECLKAMDYYEMIDLSHLMISQFDHRIAYDNRIYYDQYQKGIDEAKAVLEKKDISLDEWKMRTTEVLALENKMKITDVDFRVQGCVIHCNDLTIVTFPGELASKFGLQLRSLCKSRYFLLIGYANDYQGYFIEAEEYGKTYETKASNTPKGESEKLVREIGELL